jgi:uncharacterized membrane protein (DUF485 family)
MIRPVLTEVAIFLIPFAIYALYLIAFRKGLFDASSWPTPVTLRLLFGAFALTIVSFVLLAHFSGAPPNATYTPAHLDDKGRLVPGTDK